MRRLRFLVSEEGCEAFVNFGGLRDQLDLLLAAPNLSVTGGVIMGIAYFRILNVRLGEMARRRAVSRGEFVRLLSFGQLAVKEQARRECARSLRGDPPRGLAKGGDPAKNRHVVNRHLAQETIRRLILGAPL